MANDLNSAVTTPPTGQQGTNKIQSPLSQNALIRRATTTYLETLDPHNPSSPEEIECDILQEVRTLIEMENMTNKRKHKIPETLNAWQVAMIISHMYHVKRIAGAGLESNTEYDLVAIYQEEGPAKGTYVTSDDVFRKIARQYDLKISTREFDEMMVILGDLSSRVTRLQTAP